ncbi:MAG TPA: flavodoxin [Alkalispirochaeta sp.]|nr:flavodoxin [Alkalispirochaeta sp.]
MVTIIYGSSTLNTEYVSQRLAAAFGPDRAELFNVSTIASDLIRERRSLVFVSSTWGVGDLQDDWEAFFPQVEDIDFSDKTVALVGVGDQENYPETFCDSIAILYDAVTDRGGTIVGWTDTDDYTFTSSRAVRDGRFIGLVIDEDNQADRTDNRIREWVKHVSAAFP